MTPIWLGEATRVGRIDNLLLAMNLEEKIGQLNMFAGPGAVTGPGELSEKEAGVRKGRIGSLLNVWGAAETRSLQRLATQESHLGVPLLIGLDVIRGDRTIFPVRLAEACAMDPILWEKTARAAAEEGAKDGVAMSFTR